MKKALLYLSLLLILVIAICTIYVLNINNFQRTGQFEIAKNEKPIQIHRDEYGIAYILASSKADAIRGQGFVIGQDRLFQVEFYRALIKGELASLVGPSMLQSDIKMRILNLQENAQKNFEYLNDESKEFLSWYCEGFNEYLEVGKGELPIELKLLNIKPTPLSPLELMSVIHFVGLNHGQNMEDEVLSLNLAASTSFAHELLPLNINPDRLHPLSLHLDTMILGKADLSHKYLSKENLLFAPMPKLGSNNWAIGKNKSKSGSVIVSNDPHLDSRLLPGMFYPIGIFCPEFKSVGIAVPGIPGLIAGRNEYISFGVTNAYGDSQDLVIEKVEDGQYFHEYDKVPFTKRKELIAVKDSLDVELEIRSTVRGPVISDFPVFDVRTKDVVSLKWSQSESKSRSIGIEKFLECKNVFEFRNALLDIDNMFFNFVIGDVDGNIAHQATGLIPQRIDKDGTIPSNYNQTNKWNHFIPKDSLPHTVNPKKEWVGSANHDTRPDNYPYYYSEHFSPNYRYSRIKEVLSKNKKFDSEDIWQLILDCKNKQAEKLCPLLVNALQKNNDTQNLAKILDNWNHVDDINEVGATIFNVLYDKLLNLILDDELPDELESTFWQNQYYWNQRIDNMIASNHHFIDNIQTEKREALEELVIRAGIETNQFLTKKLGPDQRNWIWGKVHPIKFVSPIRREGLIGKILGREEFAKSGSNQTLNRGAYKKRLGGQFETNWFSSFRMVADLSDNEKLMGALAGGNSSRIFHPYYKSQLEIWKTNKWIPYWISQEKVLEHSQYTLTLN